MHANNYIHRDLKPDNIMLGLGDASNTIHMIDFGLTRSVIDPKTGEHIPFKSDKNLVGTCRFVSVNAHKGYELSRRDDLISLGYIIIHLFKGSLPWQDIDTRKPSARYRRLGRAKAKRTNQSLCSECPTQFLTYMDYVSSLEFEKAADYDYLKSLIRGAAFENNYDLFDNVFDWSIRLTQPKIVPPCPVNVKEPISENSKLRPFASAIAMRKSSKRVDDEFYALAKAHRFETFEDVKRLIYDVYGQRANKEKENRSKNKDAKEKQPDQKKQRCDAKQENRAPKPSSQEEESKEADRKINNGKVLIYN